jgi:uncharacterized protein (DUF2267 family)
MPALALEVITTTLRKTNLWLAEIMEALGWSDPHRAYVALRGVLHTLRDHLTVDEAVQLGAQLPMLLRGLYYDGWKPAGKPVHARHRDEFLVDAMSGFGDAALANILLGTIPDVETIVRAVLRVLSRHTTVAPSVRHVLPAEIRSLWPPER